MRTSALDAAQASLKTALVAFLTRRRHPPGKGSLIRFMISTKVRPRPPGSPALSGIIASFQIADTVGFKGEFRQ